MASSCENPSSSSCSICSFSAAGTTIVVATINRKASNFFFSAPDERNEREMNDKQQGPREDLKGVMDLS
jgi:uncharacterized protein YccT (UPF0319 family)